MSIMTWEINYENISFIIHFRWNNAIPNDKIQVEIGFILLQFWHKLCLEIIINVQLHEVELDASINISLIIVKTDYINR